MCANAIRLPVESVGLNCSHWVRSLENASPPIMITLVEPVARTALTRLWNPATWYPMPGQVPPSRQQVQPAVSLLPLARSGKGSLNRSKTTALLPLKVLATPVQNIGAHCASGIGFWQIAFGSVQLPDGPVYAPKLQCISTIGVMPLATSRFT